MRRLRILALRLRSLLRPRRVDRELDDELRYHLDRQIEALIAAGETPETARRLALQDMGGVEQRREECRDTRGVRLISSSRGTFRDALRAIRRRPAAGFVIVATLALGIGGGATMLAVDDSLLLRPPAAIHEPNHVVTVPLARNYVVFGTLRDATTTLDMTAYTRPPALSLGSGTDATSVRLECVTPSYFRVLGTPVTIGRSFSNDDAALDTNLAIILAHHFWRRRFQGDEHAIGQAVQIARRTYTIVGIAPPNFRGVEAEPVDGWIVLEASPATCSFTGANLLYSSSGAWLWSLARLRPDATHEQAIAEVQTLQPAIDAPARDENIAPRSVSLPTLAEVSASRLTGDRHLALWLFGGGLALLLIACANVAGVLAIRAIDRQREFAIRAQLGASRSRIVAQVMTESVMWGVLSGAAAWGLALGLDRALRHFFPFSRDDGLLDGRFFAGLAAATVLAGVLSGIPPAAQAARTNVKGTAGLGVTRRSSRLRNSLLIVQVALALVLATAAGLFARSAANARTGLGYDATRVLVATVDFERAGYRRQAQIQQFFERLVERARETPEVDRIAVVANAPLTNSSISVRAVLPRGTLPKPGDSINDVINAVSAGYFTTIGTHIVRGRDFLDTDDASARPVMIVDEGTAARLWPDKDAVGQCAILYPDTRCLEIVGVVESRRHYSLISQASEFFLPNAQLASLGIELAPRHILLRVTSSSDATVGHVATALRSAAPDMPFVNVQRLDDLVDSRARTWRLGSALFSFFGTAAVGLAALGIFAALSFAIRQRTPELGLRLALGATHTRITWIVVRLALVVIVAGLTIGGVTAFFAARLIETSLFGVTPTDTGAYVSAMLATVAAGAAACLLPCLHTRRIDPIVVLKTE